MSRNSGIDTIPIIGNLQAYFYNLLSQVLRNFF
uniref:Uncharacterized protein n=1 Tax=Heterorhabditis bacteriophora TaxID=37862 RepID=A0A1I7X916_HETBA